MSHADTQIKTGSYAVTTVYSMPWTKKTTPAAKTKRKKVEKKVVHEIFERCADLTKDQYWIAIFRGCAREKFPRGFQYKNGLLIHRRGNKTVRVLIPEESPTEAFSLCLSFFKNASGLMSTFDRKRIQKEEENRLLDEISEKEITWKDIKVERVKELLISEYISDVAHASGFDAGRKKELATTIKRGFMLKYFGSKNIVMEGGKIISIQGLIYNKDTNEFFIDPRLSIKRPGRKVKGLGIERTESKLKSSPIVLWEKYLENLEKKINGTGHNFQVIGNGHSGISRSGNSTSGTRSGSGQEGSTSYSGDLFSPHDTSPTPVDESY